jgi:hypothetical protein
VCDRVMCSSLHLICSSLTLGSGSRRKPRFQEDKSQLQSWQSSLPGMAADCEVPLLRNQSRDENFSGGKAIRNSGAEWPLGHHSVMGHLLGSPLPADAVRRWRGDKGQDRTSPKLSSHSRYSCSLAQVKMNLQSGVTMVRSAFQRFPQMLLGRSSYTFYPCSLLPRKTWSCSKASWGFL